MNSDHMYARQQCNSDHTYAQQQCPQTGPVNTSSAYFQPYCPENSQACGLERNENGSSRNSNCNYNTYSIVTAIQYGCVRSDPAEPGHTQINPSVYEAPATTIKGTQPQYISISNSDVNDSCLIIAVDPGRQAKKRTELSTFGVAQIKRESDLLTSDSGSDAVAHRDSHTVMSAPSRQIELSIDIDEIISRFNVNGNSVLTSKNHGSTILSNISGGVDVAVCDKNVGDCCAAVTTSQVSGNVSPVELNSAMLFGEEVKNGLVPLNRCCAVEFTRRDRTEIIPVEIFDSPEIFEEEQATKSNNCVILNEKSSVGKCSRLQNFQISQVASPALSNDEENTSHDFKALNSLNDSNLDRKFGRLDGLQVPQQILHSWVPVLSFEDENNNCVSLDYKSITNELPRPSDSQIPQKPAQRNTEEIGSEEIAVETQENYNLASAPNVDGALDRKRDAITESTLTATSTTNLNSLMTSDMNDDISHVINIKNSPIEDQEQQEIDLLDNISCQAKEKMLSQVDITAENTRKGYSDGTAKCDRSIRIMLTRLPEEIPLLKKPSPFSGISKNFIKEIPTLKKPCCVVSPNVRCTLCAIPLLKKKKKKTSHIKRKVQVDEKQKPRLVSSSNSLTRTNPPGSLHHKRLLAKCFDENNKGGACENNEYAQHGRNHKISLHSSRSALVDIYDFDEDLDSICSDECTNLLSKVVKKYKRKRYTFKKYKTAAPLLYVTANMSSVNDLCEGHTDVLMYDAKNGYDMSCANVTSNLSSAIDVGRVVTSSADVSSEDDLSKARTNVMQDVENDDEMSCFNVAKNISSDTDVNLLVTSHNTDDIFSENDMSKGRTDVAMQEAENDDETSHLNAAKSLSSDTDGNRGVTSCVNATHNMLSEIEMFTRMYKGCSRVVNLDNCINVMQSAENGDEMSRVDAKNESSDIYVYRGAASRITFTDDFYSLFLSETEKFTQRKKCVYKGPVNLLTQQVENDDNTRLCASRSTRYRNNC